MNNHSADIPAATENTPVQQVQGPPLPPAAAGNPYLNYPVFALAKKERPVYSVKDSIFALLTLLSGYLFSKFVIWGQMGVSVTIFFLFCLATAVFYMESSKLKASVPTVLSGAVLCLFSFNFCLSSNGMIKLLDLLFLIAGGGYFVFSAFRLSGKLRSGFLRDLGSGLIIVPFTNYDACPGAAAQLLGRTKATKKLKWILLGVLIAVPVTAIAAALLFSGDVMFRLIFSFSVDDAALQGLLFILQLSLGIPVAFWFFGLLYGSKNKKAKPQTAAPYPLIEQKPHKKTPPSLVYAALTPLCILYLLFFFSQAGYFLSAFKKLLPAGFGYAEYARNGFFELCVVVVINLAVIGLAAFFCGRKDGRLPKAARVYCIILSVFTLALIASALSKMVMYIDSYGLTAMRIYPSWFMILLACVFILLIIKMIQPKFCFPRAAVVSFVLLFAVLSFANIDASIAKYNVQWYEEGKIGWMGYYAVSELDDSAVEYILPLYEKAEEDSEVKTSCKKYLQRVCDRYHPGFLDYNLQSSRAQDLLTAAGFQKTPDYDPGTVTD